MKTKSGYEVTCAVNSYVKCPESGRIQKGAKRTGDITFTGKFRKLHTGSLEFEITQAKADAPSLADKLKAYCGGGSYHGNSSGVTSGWYRENEFWVSKEQNVQDATRGEMLLAAMRDSTESVC